MTRGFILAVMLNCLLLLAPLLISHRWLALRRLQAQQGLAAAFVDLAQNSPPPFPTGWSLEPPRPQWWVSVPDQPETYLFQLPNGRTGCAWRSALVANGRLLIFGKWRGIDKKDAPLGGDLPSGLRRTRLGPADSTVYAYTDQSSVAEQILNGSGFVAAFVDSDLLGTLQFCYLDGWAVLLTDSAEITTRQEAGGFVAATTWLERALRAPYIEPDGRISCAWAKLDFPPATTRLCPTAAFGGGFRMAAWFAFPYLCIFAPMTGTRAQLLAMPICLLITVAAGLAARHSFRLARSGRPRRARLTGKDFDSDSDGTAYWLLLRCDPPDAKPVDGLVSMRRQEWEAARDDWQTVVLVSPNSPTKLRYPWELSFFPCPYAWHRCDD
jgi:hypothetical protein